MHDMKAGAAYQGVLEQNLGEVDKKQYQEYYRKVKPMANMNVPGPQYGSPTAYRTPALQTGAEDDDIEREFVFEDTGAQSTGIGSDTVFTVNREDKTTRVNEPEKLAGQTPTEGDIINNQSYMTQNNSGENETADLEIVDDLRTNTGRGKPGKEGEAVVNVPAGTIEVSRQPNYRKWKSN